VSRDNEKRPGDKEKGRGSWGILWREGMLAMALGWELAIPIFVGVLLGNLLDRWLGTGYIFTIGLLVAGVAAGYYSVARTVARIERRQRKDDERKDDEES
jgi:ATP synthase protein I